jgi:hypothetical protein
MRKFFSDLSGKDAPSVLDVGRGAAGRALGIVKRGAQSVAVVFKKKEDDVEADSLLLFNKTIESIHTVVLVLAAKSMDSAECCQMKQAQETLQHMAQHVQVRYASLCCPRRSHPSALLDLPGACK